MMSEPIRPEDMIGNGNGVEGEKSTVQTLNAQEGSYNGIHLLDDIKTAISSQEHSLDLLRKIVEKGVSNIEGPGSSLQIVELQNEVKRLEDDRVALRKVIGDKESESTILKSQIENLAGEVLNLKDSLSAEEDVLEKKDEEKSRLEADLQKKEKELEDKACELELQQEEVKKLEGQLECVNGEKLRLQEDLVKSDNVRTELSKQIYELNAQIESEKATAEKNLKESLEQSKSSMPNVRSYPQEAVRYATCSLRLIELIYASFQKLDDIIKLYYQNNDDANYFYVRRRLKFMEAGGNFSVMRKWAGELDSFVKTGFVVVGSDLQKAFGDTPSSNLAAAQYYLYTNLFKHIAGPGVILIREIRNMGVYTGVANIPNPQELEDIETEMLQCISSLGFSVVDVELFKPLPLSDKIDCVEKVSNKLPGTTSGDVIEITKLAVLYGNVYENTEVKVES